MKYLFFDLEFANCYGGTPKMCEFGFVKTDENFTVAEKENLIINPDISDWDRFALKYVLTRTRETYVKSEKFDGCYNRIKSVLTSADAVFGFAPDLDVKAINADCERYGLNRIDFGFYDVQAIYKRFHGDENAKGLKGIMDELCIAGEETEHDALADAYNTMLVMKAVLNLCGCGLTEALSRLQIEKGESKNHVARPKNKSVTIGTLNPKNAAVLAKALKNAT